MRKRRTYGGDFKAKVVREYIEGKKGLVDLALEYQVHPNQIKNWKSSLFRLAHLLLQDRRRDRRSEAREPLRPA
jgi:transposase-like protein